VQASLAVAEVKLNAAQSELGSAVALLDEKEAELKRVQEIYDTAMVEKQALLDDANLCKQKMMNASTLIDGLGDEKIRWTASNIEFRESIDK